MSTQTRFSVEEFNQIAEELEEKPAEEVIAWGVKQFGAKLALACSFGAEDVVLVDMLVKADPDAKIFYLDTNLHFQETYETRDRIAAKYGISLIQVLPQLTLSQQAGKYGDELWKHDPGLCCNIRKVEPMKRVLSTYDAWMTGIRREQSPTRANAKKVEWDKKFGLVKFNPLADWTYKDVWNHIVVHDVPYNPLHDQNYPSIGCEKCTKPVLSGQDPRSGRWAGFEKTECGLHVE